MALAMEGARKKRKIAIEGEEEEEEEDEDVKMEKFFALIRTAKDIRDRLLEPEESRQQKKKAPRATPVSASASAAAAVDGRESNLPWRLQPFPALQNLGENQEKETPLLLINQEAANCARRSEDDDDNKADDDDKHHHVRGRRFELDLNLSL